MAEPTAPVPAGLIAVRAKLVGPSPEGLKVELVESGESYDGRFNRADADGELLLLYPRSVTPDATTGLISFDLRVDGGAHAVTQIDLVCGSTTQTFAGSTFTCAPGRILRARVTFT